MRARSWVRARGLDRFITAIGAASCVLLAALAAGGCEIVRYPYFTPLDPGVLWVANSADNTVTCIDRVNDTVRGTWTVGPNPSRTAVDMAGNCWVGSRGDGTVWFVTPAGRTLTFDGFSAARGVALDRNGDVWVANSGNATIQKISVRDGTVSQQLSLGGVFYYGALVDSGGILWVADTQGQQMIRYDTAAFPGGSAEHIALPGSIYGFTIDTDDTVWVAGTSGPILYRIATGASTVETIDLPGQTGGLFAAVFDANGRIWATNDGNNRLVRYNPGDGQVAAVQLDAVSAPLESGTYPHGLGADEEGYVYSVNMSSNNVSKVEAESCQVVETFHVGATPYTYSDLTGFIYRNVTRKPRSGMPGVERPAPAR
jgi:streptogramin lyase